MVKIETLKYVQNNFSLCFVTEKKIKSLERQVREKDVKYREMRKEFEKGMRGQYFSETLTLRNVGAKSRGNGFMNVA